MAIKVGYQNLYIWLGLAIATVSFTAIACAADANSKDGIEQPYQKVGNVRTLPSLQTRAKPPLQPETLHLGMLESQFFEYAKDNNWAAIATTQREQYTMHQLQPGGEGLYALPDRKLVYVRGFTASIYFENERLMGMRLTADNRDRPMTTGDLLLLVRAWFPDDMLSVIYQVAPDDPRKSVVETLIGTIPKSFEQDLGKVSLPFCRAIVFPSPIPVNTLSTCNLSI
ncbi:MAG: hypothetical protein AUK48_05330 [Oscillatoriales cyanobacterium CG2_30_44_21]|nr:MAG: hypothetical protein AUK48_05330 [Oscillatoriales cyanobacterium CG2_30_44_21]